MFLCAKMKSQIKSVGVLMKIHFQRNLFSFEKEFRKPTVIMCITTKGSKQNNITTASQIHDNSSISVKEYEVDQS